MNSKQEILATRKAALEVRKLELECRKLEQDLRFSRLTLLMTFWTVLAAAGKFALDYIKKGK